MKATQHPMTFSEFLRFAADNFLSETYWDTPFAKGRFVGRRRRTYSCHAVEEASIFLFPGTAKGSIDRREAYCDAYREIASTFGMSTSGGAFNYFDGLNEGTQSVDTRTSQQLRYTWMNFLADLLEERGLKTPEEVIEYAATLRAVK